MWNCLPTLTLDRIIKLAMVAVDAMVKVIIRPMI